MQAADKTVVKGDTKANRNLGLGEGGQYWIADCSTDDFLPTERLEGTKGRARNRLQIINHSGDGDELALAALTEGVLKSD